MSADAIVVGAGICGAAAAHFLAERGAEVLVLDRAGVAEGTTGLGEGNVLVCDKPPGIERDLAVRGRELWGRLGERFAAARVTRKGALVLDHPDGADMSPLEPSLAAGIRCVHEPDELQVDPAGLARAMLAPLRVITSAEVLSVDAGSVTLAGGDRRHADHVIVATGPWAAELTGLPVQPRKGQLAALSAPPELIRHKLIEAAYTDVVASTGAERLIATVVEQTLDGDEVLVGSSRERVGFDPRVDDRVTAAMIGRAARFVPALAQLPVRRAWCGFRPWLPDGLPAVGPIGDRVWTSCGHEGSGVGLGPLSGLLLAQLIAGEDPVCDPSPVDPRRFGSRCPVPTVPR
ncbi:MAG: NAD(P)/FAD-dependent oxidoreductase [Solirubrobacteraceae bacterium]